MSLLKRLSITLFSRLDDVVADIENHDALIEAAMKEQSKKIATARIQFNHLTRRKKAVEAQLEQLARDEKSWQSRALKEAATDEAKALECLKRRKLIQQQIGQLNLSQQEYHLACEKLAADVQRSETELKDVQQKRDLLRARQSSADVLNNLDNNYQSNLRQMEKTFERWEANLVESALLHDDDNLVDTLERAYLDEENEQALKEELAKIIETSQQEKTDE